MTVAPVPAVLLASASLTRLALLSAVGVAVTAVPADLDEEVLKGPLRAAGADAGHAARHLAEAKARAVARRRPDALVIGADQILVCDGTWYDKPEDLDAARRQLLALCGKTHHLWTAAAVVRGDRLLWEHLAVAAMTMRSVSQAFLDDYLEQAGPKVLSSVGAYQWEGLGAQLFDRVDGDHFTILGLPMLPLLDFLRNSGVIKR